MRKTSINMMKPFSSLGLALAALLMASAVHAQAPSTTTAPAGIFKAVEGPVVVHSENRQKTPQVGQTISESDRIETGPKGGAALTMADGTVVTIGPNASVTLTSMRYEPVSQTGNLALQIVQGALRMITGSLGKTQPENVKVTTPTAVIGVRGTDFIVEVKP